MESSFEMKLKASQLIENIERSKDHRGSILSIVDGLIKNVSIIHCTAGTIRSNHYHLTDVHYMYVLDGSIDYFFCNLDQTDMNYIKVTTGKTIFTPALEIHATFFPVDTTLVVCSKNPRDPETYEKDTVRVEILNSQNLATMKTKYGK